VPDDAEGSPPSVERVRFAHRFDADHDDTE
jgi:hypothetical protein